MLGSLLMVEACSETDRELGEFASDVLLPPKQSLQGKFGTDNCILKLFFSKTSFMDTSK